MRIPFDLVAALLALEAVRQYLGEVFPRPGLEGLLPEAIKTPFLKEAGVFLIAYMALIWLATECLIRRTEWKTRWGRFPAGLPHPSGQGKTLHPLAFFGRGQVAIQVLSVLTYAIFLWSFQWPLQTQGWPSWVGLDRLLPLSWSAALAESLLFRNFFNLLPFLMAMLVGWCPWKRLSEGIKGRRIKLRTFLLLEARLSLLPLALWFCFFLLADLSGFFFPGVGRAFLLDEGHGEGDEMALAFSLALFFSFSLLMIVVLMPLLVAGWWGCQALPESPLKKRLETLLSRSGVKARAILSWGPSGSGLLNACVLGPWSRLRFILISPGLMEVLSDEECEAVLAHEIGHVRHGHLFLLFALFVAFTTLSGLLIHAVEVFFGVLHPLGEGLVYFVFILLALRFFWGSISRACELEADLTSIDLMGSPWPLASALEKLASLSGGIRDLYSWHHDSIARRIECLARMGAQECIRQEYYARLRFLKSLFFAFTALALAVFFSLGS